MARSQLHVFIVLYLVRFGTGHLYCDKNEVNRNWKLCERTYLINGDVDNATNICNNSECLIQCKMDAVGDCAREETFLDKLLNYDPYTMKIFYRIACSNHSFFEEQSKGDVPCKVNDSLCNTDVLSSQLSQGRLNLYENAKYDLYKGLLCNVSDQTRKCIRVTHSENCSGNSARIFNDMIKVSSSLSICDNADIKNLYTKYDGSVKCLHPKLDSHCFKSSLMSRVTNCETLPLRSILDGKLPQSINEFCNAQECNTDCYEEALRNCDKQMEHLELDPIAVRVTNRVACEKQEELTIAVSTCALSSTSCYTDFRQAELEAEIPKTQLNYTAYKNKMCSATSDLLGCVDYVVSGNCTNELATLMKDMVTVLFSYAECAPQDHMFFSRYNQKTNCVTSGGEQYVINIALLINISSLLYFLFV